MRKTLPCSIKAGGEPNADLHITTLCREFPYVFLVRMGFSAPQAIGLPALLLFPHEHRGVANSAGFSFFQKMEMFS